MAPIIVLAPDLSPASMVLVVPPSGLQEPAPLCGRRTDTEL